MPSRVSAAYDVFLTSTAREKDLMNELLLISVLILMIQGGQPVGSASGFFYLKNEKIFLVTNRHVVIDEKQGLQPTSLRLRLHQDPTDLTKNIDRDVPLYSVGKPRWHVHPKYSTLGIDVAVVELDQREFSSGVYVKALSSGNFLPDKFVINPGEDLMVIGYPRGLSDSVHNLPIVRNALVSSAYGIEFENAPLFIIDANLHQGMSGSPVLTKPKNIWPDRDGNTNMMVGSPTYFLGIFSATLSKNTSANQQEPLGLGAVWYGRLVEEIIDSIAPN